VLVSVVCVVRPSSAVLSNACFNSDKSHAVDANLSSSFGINTSVSNRSRSSPRSSPRFDQMIRNARDRGIAILSGSDTGNASAFSHGKWHGKEAELFVKEIGMTPMEAIVANTSGNAIRTWLSPTFIDRMRPRKSVRT
jgi:hypothetical protein